MIEQVGLRPYDLPLHRAWGSARGGFARRRGWLVSVAADGLTGYGDCAPLPAAGTETADVAEIALISYLTRLTGQDVARCLAELDSDPTLNSTPAARYAIESALSDLASQRAQQPLRQWLAPDAADRLAVNAMLGTLGQVRADDLAAHAACGFRVCKLKVGIQTPTADLAALQMLAQTVNAEAIRLRLDANGAWTIDQARWVLEQLARFELPIESLEEPIIKPIPEHLAELQARVVFPLALDESLVTYLATHDLTQLGIKRLVLKPAVLGGLRRTLTLAQCAQATGIEVVMTSVVDSAAGLWPTVQLAAALNEPLAHGVATADWLAADLGPAPRACAGMIELSSQVGSGFELPATSDQLPANT